MFQFPSLPSPALLYSGGDTRALPRAGFPIRKSPDQRLVSISPRLIAATHVLHRLSAPRHPPCALVLLIEKNTCIVAMEFSRCARVAPPIEKNRPAAVSQNSTAWLRRGRRISRRARSPDDGTSVPASTSLTASGVRAPVSLERR
jgi:hypothetical protein